MIQNSKFKIQKLLAYGVYLLALILPFQTRLILIQGEARGGFLEYRTISLYAVDLFILVMLLLWIFDFFKKGKEIKVPAVYWWLIAGLDLILAISIFYSSERSLAFYHYLLFLEGVGLFFLVLNINFKKTVFSFFLALSLFVQGSLAIFQFFFQDSPAFKWLGMAKHFPGDLGASVIETLGADGMGERWLRAYGSFDHPNMLGAFLVLGILFLIYYYVTRKKDDRSFRLNFSLAACYIAIAGLVFTFSRSSWLALSAGAVFLLITFLLIRNLTGQLKILTVILVSSIIFFIPFTVYNNLFIARISFQGRLEEKSLNERALYLDQGLAMIKENKISGVGLGNYIEKRIEKDPRAYFWDLQPVHNTFLLVLSEAGVIGFLFFVSLFAYVAVESIDKKSFFNLSILLSLVIMMMFDHFWWSLHFGVLLYWLIMALLIKNLKR